MQAQNATYSACVYQGNYLKKGKCASPSVGDRDPGTGHARTGHFTLTQLGQSQTGFSHSKPGNYPIFFSFSKKSTD